MTANILAGLTAIVTFMFVFNMLRKGALREKYAVLWLFFSGVALIFALIPDSLNWVAAKVGVAYPVNLVFFLLAVLLVLVSVQMSHELSRHEMRIRRLAEEVALLRQEIQKSKEDQRD